MRGLTLFVPGLLGPGADKLGVAADAGLDLPALPRILAKADTSAFPWPCYEAALCGLFGISGQELPVAAITYPIDFIENTDSPWIRVDPVHLRADLHKLILFDGDFLQLTPDEAQALSGDLARALGNDLSGLRISPDAKRWYLLLSESPRLQTQPVSVVMGQDVRGLLPKGVDQGRWLRLGNEIQMVLHEAAINQRRETNRQIPANSVWFWGAGALPPAPAQCPWSAVFSDDPLALGLARWSGVPGYASGVSDVQPPSQPSPCQGEGAEVRAGVTNAHMPMQTSETLPLAGGGLEPAPVKAGGGGRRLEIPRELGIEGVDVSLAVPDVQPPSPPLRPRSGQASPCQGEGAEKRNPAVATMANSSVPMQAAGVLAALAGLNKGEALVVLPNALRPSRYSDITGWQEAMARLERDWFAPLLKAVQRGELEQLRVIADGCDFTLRRGRLWHFWRRSRALHEYQPGESG